MSSPVFSLVHYGGLLSVLIHCSRNDCDSLTWSSYLGYSVCSLSFSLHQDYVSRLQKSLFRPLCCVARFSCDLIMLMMHHPQSYLPRR